VMGAGEECYIDRPDPAGVSIDRPDPAGVSQPIR